MTLPEHRLVGWWPGAGVNYLPRGNTYIHPFNRFQPGMTMRPMEAFQGLDTATNACWHGGQGRMHRLGQHPCCAHMIQNFGQLPAEAHLPFVPGQNIYSRLARFGINMPKYPSQQEIACAIRHLETIRSQYQPEQWCGDYRPYGACNCAADYGLPAYNHPPCDCAQTDVPTGHPVAPVPETMEPPLADPPPRLNRTVATGNPLAERAATLIQQVNAALPNPPQNGPNRDTFASIVRGLLDRFRAPKPPPAATV